MEDSIKVTEDIIKHNYSKRYRPADWDRTTVAYIITQKCARLLMSHLGTKQVRRPVDDYMISVFRKRKLDILSTKPLLCHSPAEGIEGDSDVR